MFCCTNGPVFRDAMLIELAFRRGRRKAKLLVFERQSGHEGSTAPRVQDDELDAVSGGAFPTFWAQVGACRAALENYVVVDSAMNVRIVRLGQILQGLVAVMVQSPAPDRPADGLQRFRAGRGQKASISLPDRIEVGKDRIHVLV
jgi:hypothetical protein